MKFSLSQKFFLILFVVTLNGYVFLGGPFSKGELINKESRKVRNILLKEIKNLNGIILSTRGKSNGFFSIDVSFDGSDLYDRKIFITSIKGIGFVLNEEKSTLDIKLFCKDGAGILFSGQTQIRIDYDYKMQGCRNGH